MTASTDLTSRTVGSTSQRAEDPLVVVTDLHKSFVRRDGERVAAIAGASLSIAPGEFVVLLGPSGCGKTTLLRCLAGLEQPDGGTISVNGKTFFGDGGRTRVPAEARNLSMVFQSYALWPHMTVRDNVAFPLRSRKVSKREIPMRVDRALERVGVANLKDSYPSQISGGQQQRVALARALVTNDELILFDEPLSNVDARVRDELRFELLEMQRDIGFAAVYVTHDQGEAMAMADRIAVLGGGEIQQLGTPQEVYLRPSSLEVARFVGNANKLPGKAVAVDGTAVSVRAAGATVRAVARHGDISVGDDVVLVWRPENGVLVSSADETNAWHASVAASVFVGTHTESDLVVGDHKQRIWSVRGELPGHGADVLLSVAPADLLAFRG